MTQDGPNYLCTTAGLMEGKVKDLQTRAISVDKTHCYVQTSGHIATCQLSDPRDPSEIFKPTNA